MIARSARRKSSISTLGNALLGVALLGTFPPSSLRASPIRHRGPQPRVRQAPAADGFRSFLDGGAMLRARARPRMPAGLSLAAIEGPSADTSLQGYLQRRRDRNPERFDRNHPRIGPLLARQAIPLPVVVTPPIPPPTLPPVTAPDPMQVPTLTPIGPPRGPQEQTVPEPTTVVMALAMVGWGVWWRRSSGRPSRP